MGTELVKTSPVSVASGQRQGDRCRSWSSGQGGRHASPGMSSSTPSITIRTRRKAYQSAVRRFLAWAEGEGVELASISPGMVGQYLVGLGGSASKRNLHLSALRGFFDRLVQRHVVLLNPAASVSGVKETVVEGKTPEITHRAGPEADRVGQDHVHR